MTHRLYSPTTGRFITRDPIGYEGGINEYAYTRNNPVMRVDPSGTDGSTLVTLKDEGYKWVATEVSQHPEVVPMTATAVTGSATVATSSAFASSAVGTVGTAILTDVAAPIVVIGVLTYGGYQLGTSLASRIKMPTGSAAPTFSAAVYAKAKAFAELSSMRKFLRLPPANEAGGGEHVLCSLVVGGKSFIGINAHGQSVEIKSNAVSIQHAEGDAFNQAFKAGIRGGKGTLYVDKDLCGYCGKSGGVRAMMRQLGLDSLTVVTRKASYTITP